MSDEKLNLTPNDFEVANHGSLMLLYPCNDAAREWIDVNIYGTDADTGIPENEVQWFGGGIVIEPRYIMDIIDGIEADGLDVKAR